jgi:hypothetical protein
MLRILVLIGAIMFFRSLLVRKRNRSLTTTSPYMNSLDGMLSAAQLSATMEELRLSELISRSGRTAPR